MKKVIFIFLFITFISASVQAQNVVNSFLEKYGEDDAIHLISIGKKMLDKMGEESLGTSELLNAIKGLDLIRIVTSDDGALKEEYYNSACTLLEKEKDFAELYSLKNENLQLLVKVKKAKGIVNELIILSKDSSEFNLTSLTGNINLEVLTAYSTSIDFKKLEHLNIRENQ
jgi:hypothetical protein